ncbi:MAG: MBL fold metallo-hydrolase [Polyangiaceae bacterium]|nr:MBL fold metallo-hydrolase [Polyangiaceae bacterium]
MKLQHVGAARTVTGSKHLLTTDHARVLLDCGLWQGRRQEALTRNRSLGIEAGGVDVVVLSHAHIDHSGALPLLVKSGFDGPIYATSATRDLCAAMLMDAAMIQAADAKFINRMIERGESDMAPVEALYDEGDVLRVLDRFVTIPYRRRLPIARGVDVTFLDAGHVLGSAVTCLDVETARGPRRVVYTGDLGRHHIPLLRDPEIAEGAHVLVSESTYGDRLHQPIEVVDDELARAVTRTVDRGGKVIIPSFALERAQEVVYALKQLRAAGRVPKVPVYVDSPLAVKLTDVFKLHPECLDTDARRHLAAHDSPFEFDGLTYVESREESKAISQSSRPAVVIAASGMCEAGRVLHHLRAAVDDSRSTIVIVGFQAPHTLGRRLVERQREVRVFGVLRPLRAEVVVLNGFSAHADQSGLLAYARGVRARGALEQVILVHGEEPSQNELAGRLRDEGFAQVAIPAPGDELEV